jgi:tetratricopeptide (TPR) repeat protein
MNKKKVSSLTAVILILTTAAIVIGLGFGAGRWFPADSYDPDSKIGHDFKAAKDSVVSQPNNPEARVALGWSYVQLKDLDRALAQYNKALKLEPGNPVARYNIDLIEIEKKQYTEARGDLEALKKQYPSYWSARATLGYLYRLLGEYQLSIQELEEVEKFQPDLDVLYQLGLTYAQMGDKDKAKAAWQNALKFNPKNEEILNALAGIN